MKITEKILNIVSQLEDSVSYEDWKGVEDSIKELNFLIEEMDSDLPYDNYEEDY